MPPTPPTPPAHPIPVTQEQTALRASLLRQSALVLGIWTLVALFGTNLQYFAITRSGGEASWLVLLSSSLLSCWLWAAYTPLIFWLGRRYRIERDRWALPLAVHIVAGTILTALDVALLHAMGPWLNLWPNGVAPPFIIAFARQLFLYLVCYFIIVALAHAAWHANRSRNAALRAAQLEAQLNATRLHTLQSQLRPHFLFNTLNTIAEQLYLDPSGADAMITRLSRLLRSSFAEPDRQEVTLREELELLQCYLDIARVRFRERLRVEFDVHPNALDALVPRLLLQPLAENALHHGIELSPRGGRLDVVVRPHLDTITIEVRDDGVGLANDVPVEGTGLRNTRDRIRHLYGDAYGLEIHARAGGGTVVRVTLPWRGVSAQRTSERTASPLAARADVRAQ